MVLKEEYKAKASQNFIPSTYFLKVKYFYT